MKKIYSFIPLTIAVCFVAISTVISLTNQPPAANAQTNSFTFGAAGDYASTRNTDAVLTAVRNSGVAFQIAVGDLSYNTQGSPAGWGTYVKNIIGTIPFLIVMGNHDASQINQFVSALPNTMPNLQGTYGKQYYFDYPVSSPLARFIMVSPVNGTKDIPWFNSAVDSARSSGIKWIIAGMHQPCVTTGVKSCEIGQDMMDAITSKKVDVVLFGHEHNYQRSKQLSCARQNTFSSSCVVASGSSFTKDKGTVIVIVGSGGNTLYAVSANDSEAGYFEAITGTTYGFAQFTISPTQLQERFVTTNGSFSDSFSISSAQTIPSPTLPPTNPPTAQPTTPPTINPTQVTTTTIIPTFQCLGGNPCTSPLPSTQPTKTVTAVPSVIPTVSNAISIPVSQIPTQNQSPTINPCTSNTASIASSNHTKRHNKFHGENTNNGIFAVLLRFLMQLLMLLFGNGTIPNIPFPPNPSGIPTPTPCIK